MPHSVRDVRSASSSNDNPQRSPASQPPGSSRTPKTTKTTTKKSKSSSKASPMLEFWVQTSDRSTLSINEIMYSANK
jgi:hypothetical protein